MLLDHDVLAAEVWAHRLTVELEAAAQFDHLADDLEEARRPAGLVALARAAAADERAHATLCRTAVGHLGGDPVTVTTPTPARLGFPGMAAANRALYASVALSCVTETLSAALLLELHRCTTDPIIAPIIGRILRDEVRHGRLGWAHLAYEARRGDVTWLAPHVPPMLRAALAQDLPAARAAHPRPRAVSPPGGTQGIEPATVGVLDLDRVRAAVGGAVEEIICPGLERFGIRVSRQDLHRAAA